MGVPGGPDVPTSASNRKRLDKEHSVSKPKKNDSSKKPPRKKKGEGAGPAKGHEPPPPPPPPPPSRSAPPPEATAEGSIDGRFMLDAVRHVLAACPKAKDSPALAFVALKGCELRATSDYVYNTATLPAPVTAAAMKVTRGTVEEFAALLKGELDAAAVTGASVLVSMYGLIAKIFRAGSSEEPRVHLFDRFESGPDVALISMEAPAFSGHAAFDLDALRDALAWKGNGSLDVFLSEDGGQGWFDVSAGGNHVARTVVAARSRSLGIRQPTLPNTSTPAKSPRPHGTPSTPGVSPEVIYALGAGSGWVRVECNRSAAWDRLGAHDIADLVPYRIDEEHGVVSWGPYPSAIRRVGYLVARLTALCLDPREIPCDAPDLFGRALGSGEEPKELPPKSDKGIVDAEFEENSPGEGDVTITVGGESTTIPATLPIVIEIPEAIWDELSPDALEALHLPSGLKERLSWFTMPDHTTSKVLDRETAGKVLAEFAKVGLCVATVAHGRRYGIDEVNVWTAGKAAG